MIENIGLLLKGFAGNIGVTLLSAIFPLIVGIVLSFFSSKNSTVDKIFGWLSLPFECFCPLILLVFSYFCLPILGIRIGRIDFLKFIISVIAFSVCFMGYMPARRIESFSFLKNILYNGLGLIGAIFKWSFCLAYIGQADLLYQSRMLVSVHYEPIYYIIPLIFSFLFLLLIEVAKRLIKQFVK